MEVVTTLSKGYQITLPSAMRRAMALEAGDPVLIELVNGKMVLKKTETRDERIMRVFGEMERLSQKEKKKMTLEQKREAEMMTGWTIGQYHEYFDNSPEAEKQLKEKYGI